MSPNLPFCRVDRRNYAGAPWCGTDVTGGGHHHQGPAIPPVSRHVISARRLLGLTPAPSVEQHGPYGSHHHAASLKLVPGCWPATSASGAETPSTVSHHSGEKRNNGA